MNKKIYLIQITYPSGRVYTSVIMRKTLKEAKADMAQNKRYSGQEGCTYKILKYVLEETK